MDVKLMLAERHKTVQEAIAGFSGLPLVFAIESGSCQV